jgi:hypothetical protein
MVNIVRLKILNKGATMLFNATFEVSGRGLKYFSDMPETRTQKIEATNLREANLICIGLLNKYNNSHKILFMELSNLSEVN